MLTLGLIILIIALVAAIFGFGIVSSPMTGTAKIAFYFFITLAVLMLVGGVIQQIRSVDSTTPIQRQAEEGRAGVAVPHLSFQSI